jgi:hypothetical protein
VSVEVRDSGPGFAPADLDRVFEAFYTTKPEGMGLSICRSIIEAHGGRLRAIPCEPQGALFQSTIPERTGRDGVDVAVWPICDDSVGACPCRTGFHPRVKPEGMLRRDMRLGRPQGQ